MVKKWYQDPRSWLTILLIFFVPTFLIGIIVMWAMAPWSKRVKWWITGIGVGIPLIGIILAFILARVLPMKQLNTAADNVKMANVQEVSREGNRFCLAEGRCALGIQELKQKKFLNPSFDDSSVGYVQLNGGKDCIVSVTLSTNTVYSIKCLSAKFP